MEGTGRVLHSKARILGFLLALLAQFESGPAALAQGARPNIVLIVFEDMSPHLGAYGDTQAQTPILDAFATQAVLYEQAFTAAGVCAPSRAALMMGVHQQSIGAQHMRALQGVSLPEGKRLPYTAVPPPYIKAFPELLRAAGYYTTNNGKTDYQLDLSYTGGPFTVWDETNAAHPWRGRAAGQPFFAMLNINETHESWLLDPGMDTSVNPMAPGLMHTIGPAVSGRKAIADPAALKIPPFLPDTPLVRAEYAQMLDNITYAEQTVATLLAQLVEDGLASNTVVMVTSDHGDGLPRAKRSLYDSGLKVPLMVRWPDGRGAGSRNGELVSFVDIAPSLLDLAGVPVPGWMPGRDFLGTGAGPERGYIYAAMDRHDDVPDYARAVRDRRWKYIRNYQPNHAFFRPLPFRDMLRSMNELWRLNASGQLPPPIAPYFAATRPPEELYDTWNDPHEMVNLAGDGIHAQVLVLMREALARFDAKVSDKSADGELAAVERMWPNLVRPPTREPSVTRKGALLTLAAPDDGASIGFRIAGGVWQLYTGPLKLAPGAMLEAKAVRYGYAESAIVSYSQ